MIVSLLRWFTAQKKWFQGGLIGLVICFLLGIFNLFIYLPLLNRFYGDALPDWALIFPTITGYIFTFFSHIAFPSNWFCNFSEVSCTKWAVDQSTGSIPWNLDGQAGYCVNQVAIPSHSCLEFSEILGFLGVVLFLFITYFMIGALIGLVFDKLQPRLKQK